MTFHKHGSPLCWGWLQPRGNVAGLHRASTRCGHFWRWCTWLGQALAACGQGWTTPHPFFQQTCCSWLYCDLYLCWGWVCSVHLPDHRFHSFVEESELPLLSPAAATYLSPVAYTVPEDQFCIKCTRPKPHCIRSHICGGNSIKHFAYPQNSPKLRRPIKVKIPCALKLKPGTWMAVVKIQFKKPISLCSGIKLYKSQSLKYHIQPWLA